MLLLIASVALAQDPKPDIRYEQVSEVDFLVPLEVDGELVKPLGSVEFEARRKAFARLFPIRADFDREIVQSADEIK